MALPTPPRARRGAALAAALAVALLAAGTAPAGAQSAPTPPPPATAPAGESFEGRFVVERHGSGRPMILIPGLSSSGDVWRGAVERYAGSYELHVLTLAGFAGVPPVEPEDGAHFLEGQRDAIIRYVRARGLERPVLVGHSLGAFLAFWIAASAPDLAGPVVAVDGVPYLVALMDSTATPERMRPQAEATVAMFRSLTPDQMAAQGRLAVMGGITDSAHHGTAIGWSRTSDPATVGRAVAEMLTTDLRESVAAIRAPVLLVGAVGALPAGQRDGARRAYEAQVARVRDHRVVTADARHFVMLDAPDFLFTTMDEFLARHTADATRARGAEANAKSGVTEGGR